MSATLANRIGPYEIVSTLGAGGMGEVFLAWDYRLQREVAIKVVKSSSGDPDCQMRFLQEARAAGGLNHPNILTVHDVGVENGFPYLVSERIEGDSLRSLLNAGTLSIGKVLDLAVQILDGLTAAHRAGIVHRDLKPANIMITKAGLVKLLDFGLAKQVNALPGSLKDLTEPGLIIGTATYMSPEQARGESVDIRSDQFSFGLILYEMLAGTPAFDRGDPIQTMAAIINEDCPPISIQNPALPAPLAWIVDRCLAKDRESRYASTFDLCYDLKTLRQRMPELALEKAPPAPKSHKRVPFLGLMLVSLPLLVSSVWLLSRLPGSIDFRQYRLTPVATTGAFEAEPAWSPDGRSIAYTGDAGHVRQLFVRNLSANAAAQISRLPHDCSQPSWSPDGGRIFYLAPDESGASALWSVGATGGEPQRLKTDVTAAAVATNGTFAYLGPEPNEGLSLWIAPNGQFSASYRYAEGDWSHRSFRRGYLSFSPDGKSIGLWLATWSGLSEFWVLPYPAGQPRRAFTFDDGIYPFHWMPEGDRILFGGVLPGTIGSDLQIADLASGRFSPITKTTQDAIQPAISADSKHIAFTVAEHDFDLLQMSVADPTLTPLVASSRNEFSPAWSPVGSQLAFASDRTGMAEIWVRSIPDGWERPLVSAKDFARSWVSSFSDISFSRDGQRLAFSVSRAGAHSVYIVSYAGGSPTKLTTHGGEERAPSWSPDGNSIAFAVNRNDGWWLATAPSGGASSPSYLQRFPYLQDVRWASASNVIACNTRDKLFLVSPDGAQSKVISNAQWLTFDWQKDGAALVGIIRRSDGGRALATLDTTTGVLREISTLDLPSVAEIGRVSVGRDGQHIAVAIGKPHSDIWMLEGFGGEQNLFDWVRRLLLSKFNQPKSALSIQ